MRAEILAIATATPPHRLDRKESLELAHRMCCTDERQARLATALYSHSGVQSRYTAVPYTQAYQWLPEATVERSDRNEGPSTAERMALYAEHAPPLALEASREALHRASVAPSSITHVVTASCTGFLAPGIDCALIHDLSLSPSTQRVHVGYMGCHGAINALRVAHGLSCHDPGSRILVCAVELCSIHYCFHWNSERMLGNALFADGAGALVIAPRSDEFNNRSAHRWNLVGTGSYLFPETTDCMTWSVGNAGFAMTISSRLPELIKEHLGQWLIGWLANHDLSIDDVESWAIHPGGPKILEAAESALGIPQEKTRVSREILSQYGNMSSATVLFIVKELLSSGAAPPCVMLGFGPGLVAEVALLR